MAAPDPRDTPEAASHEAFPPARLRSAMGRFPTGVTVVGALSGGEPAGLSANAVSSLSLEPPLMLACIDRGSRTLRAIEAAGRFGINLLGAGSADLAIGFSRPVPIAEKWVDVGWREHHGTPMLDAAILWIGCELDEVISGGDHMIVTGAVLATEERPGEPLIFHEGEYRPLDRE